MSRGRVIIELPERRIVNMQGAMMRIGPPDWMRSEMLVQNYIMSQLRLAWPDPDMNPFLVLDGLQGYNPPPGYDLRA